MDFVSSGYARDFFQGQVPQIIRSLKSIAASQEKLVELQMQQNSSAANPVEKPAVFAEGTIYVCYEENSVALYADAGNINHMFVTADENQMREWVSKSLQYAENGKYYPIDESEKEQFFSEIGVEHFSSLWVYLNRKEDARENYGICVDVFNVSNSDQHLKELFEVK